ncbi:ribonuclease domain-containing protein [Streptomyces sp. NPDC007205]|uniref:ribonuclease domain-containing protein n=1 Tax=Streptomyces sp. NPDC007205 TaxID=3154316 RepID=UPI0033E8B773
MTTRMLLRCITAISGILFAFLVFLPAPAYAACGDVSYDNAGHTSQPPRPGRPANDPCAGQARTGAGTVAAGAAAATAAAAAVSAVRGRLAGSGSPQSNANAARLSNLLKVVESANPLVDSLRRTGTLPSHFVTKSQAMARGWVAGKAVNNHVPGGQIGGDPFMNTDGRLPSAAGRTWHEADVGLVNTMGRNKQPGTRLLWSDDGLLYVTTDHYKSFDPIGRWKD